MSMSEGQQASQKRLDELATVVVRLMSAGEALLEDPRLRSSSPQREAVLSLAPALAAAQESISSLPLAAKSRERLAMAFRHLQRGQEIMALSLQASQGPPGGLRAAYGELCSAQAYLYPLRLELPGLEAHWLTPEAAARLRKERRTDSPSSMPVGALYKDWSEHSPRYSLYVPEDYDPSCPLPLVVALHGAGGDDRLFLWLWLRQAKSRGYLLLVPKSQDMTWSFSDLHAVVFAIKEVKALYQVESGSVFLTGFSDGGTFTYEFGLGNPEVFAAIAPIAGALVPWPWLDLSRSRHLAVYILQGALDNQAPVQMARQSRDILEHFGYQVAYHEYPEWGHTYPFSRLADIFSFFDEFRASKAEKG